MSYTPQSHAIPHKVEIAPSSSTNRSKKGKNNEREIDCMCSCIGTRLKLWQQWYLR